MVDDSRTRPAMVEWLMAQVAAVLDMAPDSIDIGRNLEDYGLDSLQAVGLAGDLERWLGIEIQPTLIWDYGSIEAVCDFLARQLPIS